jgi:hypothetical protein
MNLRQQSIHYSLTLTFTALHWRSLPFSFCVHTYLQPKHILVFNGLDNYYGTSGRLNCPFNEEILKKKCIIKEDRLLEISNHLVYDAYVGVRNWKHVLYDQKIPWAKHIYYIQESPFVAKYADLSINNAILASYWRGSDIVLPYGHYEKFGGSPPHKSKYIIISQYNMGSGS